MTDRVPGAPGQYILTVSAAEAQKILTGEPVAVTLKRDDQPLVEGTPYNKAAVLPDKLASILCPGALDPTPADAFLGVLKKAAPYNYAHNSDFTQWVNQAGFGKSHAGSLEKYAGDRWILDSGTVTGEAREDGNGYTNITLNGTISQIVENAPDVGTTAIEMVSGTADISYDNGVITITSNGGVIKNVRLFQGNYTADNLPVYQPKGYGVEVVNCNGGALSMDLLWENGSPTSTFIDKTISLNLSEYEEVEIECNRYSTYGGTVFTKLKKGDTGRVNFAEVSSSQNVAYLFAKIITVNATSIDFDNTIFMTLPSGTTNENNAYLIPTKIYGIKGVPT